MLRMKLHVFVPEIEKILVVDDYSGKTSIDNNNCLMVIYRFVILVLWYVCTYHRKDFTKSQIILSFHVFLKRYCF